MKSEWLHHLFGHYDTEGCEDEGQATAAAIQSSPAPAAQIRTNVNHGGLTPQTLAALRARFARSISWLRNLATKLISTKALESSRG